MKVLNIEDDTFKHNDICKALSGCGIKDVEWSNNLADGISLSRTAMAMAETVNIPSLPHGATWRRSSETTAGRRKSPLKGV